MFLYYLRNLSITSVYDILSSGSSSSTRRSVRTGCVLSSHGCGLIGSSLSLRSFACCESTLSVSGLVHAGSVVRLSLVEGLEIASIFSVRSFGTFVRLGKNISAFNFVNVASSVSLRNSFSCGKSCSVLNFVSVGSGLSIRSFCRVSSSCSMCGPVQLSTRLSVSDWFKIGSVFSCRGNLRRTGRRLSVGTYLLVDSSCSIRQSVRVDSVFSVTGLTVFSSISNLSVIQRVEASSLLSIRARGCVGQNRGDGKQALSNYNSVHFGSCVAIRRFCNLPIRCTLLDYCRLGSSISFRSFGRSGSAPSMYGAIPASQSSKDKGVLLDSSPSVLQSVEFGSIVSVRSLTRLGLALSVCDTMSIESSLSVRQFVRCSSTCSVVGALTLGDSNKVRGHGYGFLSVADFGPLESTTSVRKFCRTGQRCSALGVLNVDSNSSVRCQLKCPSVVSVKNFHGGSSLSVRRFSRFDSAISIFAKTASSHCMSVLDFLNSGSAVSTRSYSRLDSSFSIVGKKRINSRFSMLDRVALDSALSLRNFIRLGSVVSIYGKCRAGGPVSLCNFCIFDSGMSVRAFVRLGSTLSAYGQSCKSGACTGSSCLSVRSFVRLGSSCSVAGLAAIGSFQKLSTVGFYQCASSLAIRQYVRSGAEGSIFGSSSMGSNSAVRNVLRIGRKSYSSVLDYLNIESSLSLRACLVFRAVNKPRISVLDAMCLGSNLSVRQAVAVPKHLSVYGSSLHGSILSVRRFGRCDRSLAVFDGCCIDSNLSVRDNVKNCGQFSIDDRNDSGSCLSVRQWLRLGSYLSARHNIQCHDCVSVRDNSIIYDTFSVGSTGEIESRISTIGSIALDSSLSVRNFIRLSSTLSCAGMFGIGSCMKLSLVGLLHIGSTLSVRSFVRAGDSLTAKDAWLGDSSVSIRSFVRIGSGSSGFSKIRVGGQVSFLDQASVDSNLSIRNFFRTPETLSAREWGEHDSAVSVRSWVMVDSALSVFGKVRTACASSILSYCNLGSALSTRGYGRFGARCSLVNSLFVGSTVSVRAFCRLGSSLSVLSTYNDEGNPNNDSGWLVVLNNKNADVSAKVTNKITGAGTFSVRQYVRFGSSCSCYDNVAIGSCFSVRQFARCSSSLSVLGKVRLANQVSMMGATLLGSTLSVRGYKRCGGPLSVIHYTHVASSFSVRRTVGIGGFTYGGSTYYNVHSTINHSPPTPSPTTTRAVKLGGKLSIGTDDDNNSSPDGNIGANLKSSLSIRGFLKIGKYISVLDCANFGSSLSVRQKIFAGAWAAGKGCCSVKNEVYLKETLSILGASQAFICAGHANSYLSVRDDCTPTYDAGIDIGYAQIRQNKSAPDQTTLDFYPMGISPIPSSPSSDPFLRMIYDSGNPAGTQHFGRIGGGSPNAWTVETNGGNVSDKRLKLNVHPLIHDLVTTYQRTNTNDREINTRTSQELADNAVRTIVSTLRPVSFKYKQSSESKFSRFGFIAQEVEAVLPSVVVTEEMKRKGDDEHFGDARKAIRYTDLLAVITMGLHSIDRASTELRQEINVIAKQVHYDTEKRLGPRLEALEKVLTQLVLETYSVESVHLPHVFLSGESNSDKELIMSLASNVLLNNTGSVVSSFNEIIIDSKSGRR